MSGEYNRELGRWGEAAAANYLRKNGCTLVASGWRCRFGELDLIAQKGRYLILAEVKLRKSERYGRAAEFVDWRKQERLRTTAELYLVQNPTELQPRFDVIEVYAPQGISTVNPDIIWHKNAF